MTVFANLQQLPVITTRLQQCHSGNGNQNINNNANKTVLKYNNSEPFFFVILFFFVCFKWVCVQKLFTSTKDIFTQTLLVLIIYIYMYVFFLFYYILFEDISATTYCTPNISFINVSLVLMCKWLMQYDGHGLYCGIYFYYYYYYYYYVFFYFIYFFVTYSF